MKHPDLSAVEANSASRWGQIGADGGRCLGHGAKFGHKKDQAIAALLSHRNMEEAARAVGINPNTLLRWTKEPEFDAAYQEARRTAFSQSIARLQQASSAAVSTVLKIMVDSNVPAGTRLRASEIVLERAAKATEIENIAARVAELERAADLAKRPRQRSAILILSGAKTLPSPATTPAQISAPDLGSSETDGDAVE